jgi:putative ABC transport system permease protein
MTAVLADLRFAARALARSPGFTFVVVATLAVGIGAATALFSLVDAVLLRPLPFREPQRLVEIWGQDGERTGMRIPGPLLDAVRASARTLQVIGTHDPYGGVLHRGAGAVDVRGETVSANFTAVFGVQPRIGRAFVPEDERPGAPAVMLVSHDFWQRFLDAAPDAVGRTVYLDTVPYTVIGVMPADFRTTFLSSRVGFWTPFAGSRSRERERELGYEVVARLADGVSVEQARSEMNAIASTVDVPEWRMAGRRIGLVPLKEEVVGNRAYLLTLLLAAVGVVLAIASANVAQLLLARSDRRIREFATRKAIGAGTFQLFRLALCESLLLSCAGGAAGTILAYWSLPPMLALAPLEIPRLAEASIDGRVLSVALATSVLTGLLFGSAPALRLSRLSLVQAVKPSIGSASKQGARLRGGLVVLQVAGAVVLTALAGLIVQTFVTLLPVAPGFATESRAAFGWALVRPVTSAPDRRARVADWRARLEATPGITAVALGTTIPFSDDESMNVAVRRPDDRRPAKQAPWRTELRGVSVNYFQLFQIPLLSGRAFTTSDRAESPRVAIVNQTLARRLDSGSGVIGQSIRLGNADNGPLYEIIGVAADTRWWGMTLDPLNEVYTPFAQDNAMFGYVVVQSSLDAATLTSVIRSAFYAAVPGAALTVDRRAVPFDEMISRSVAGPRFSAALIGAFSITAFTLAAIGLFGLVAYSVSQRRQEFGIRTALGARPRDLVMATVRSAVLLAALGILAGIAGGVYATRFVESQLYGIDARDVPTFAGAAVLMLVTAALAAIVPARRAAHADALAALRYE